MNPSTDPSNINANLTKGGKFFFAYKDVGQLVTALVGAALVIAGVALLLLLAYGGLQWMTSQGDKQKLEKAQNILSNALVGLTVVAASWAVYRLVIYFLQLESINLVG